MWEQIAANRRKSTLLVISAALLLGALGWSAYDGKADVVTPYFGASGTGQINAVFPVTPQDGAAVPPPEASRASGFKSFPRL